MSITRKDIDDLLKSANTQKRICDLPILCEMDERSNEDLSQGQLNKDPSRIILSEILTLDKTRLAQKIGTVKPDVLDAITYGIAKQLSIPIKTS